MRLSDQQHGCPTGSRFAPIINSTPGGAIFDQSAVSVMGAARATFRVIVRHASRTACIGKTLHAPASVLCASSAACFERHWIADALGDHDGFCRHARQSPGGRRTPRQRREPFGFPRGRASARTGSGPRGTPARDQVRVARNMQVERHGRHRDCFGERRASG